MSKGKGAIIIVVGGQDSGKTRYIIGKLLKSHRWKFIYDHWREYAKRFGTKQTTLFYSLSVFFQYIKFFWFGNVVIEEATNFIDGHSKKEIIETITGIFHQGNVLYLVFHTLEDVPGFLINKAHVLVLFNTADQPLQVKKKHPSYWHYLLHPQKPVFIQIQPFN